MLAQLLPHYQTECSHVLPPPPLYRGKLLPPLFLHLFLDRGLLLLPELVRGGRGADRNLRLVPAKKSSMCLLWSKLKLLIPVSVVFQGIEDFLGIWVDKIGPCLPQWVDNIVDETDLTSDHVVEKHKWRKKTCDFSMVALYRSHMGLISRPASRSLSPCWKNSSMILSTQSL